MTKQAVMLRETADYKDNHKSNRDAVKARRLAKKTAKKVFNGKSFDELSASDKDALLRAIAIQFGFIKE